MRLSEQYNNLHLATTVHIVALVSSVFVPAFAAIELIPILPVEGSDKRIDAVPTIEDILPTMTVACHRRGAALAARAVAH